MNRNPSIGIFPEIENEMVFRKTIEKEYPDGLIQLAQVDPSVDTTEMENLNNQEGFELTHEVGVAPVDIVRAVLSGTSNNPCVVVRQLCDVFDDYVSNIPKFGKLSAFTKRNYNPGRRVNSKHLNRIMLLACNNRSLQHRPEGVVNSCWEQMQKIYLDFQKMFFVAKEDSIKMTEMIENPYVDNYIHFIFFQSMWRHNESAFPERILIHPLQMKLFSSCSFHATTNGCNVDWLLTNSCHPANLQQYMPNSDMRTIKGYGFATLHLVMIQDWMDTAGRSNLLFLECDRKEAFPYMIYRNLIFTHCDKKTKIPDEILALIIPDSNLELLHSTVRVRDVLAPHGYDVWKNVFEGAVPILKSHGMPKFCNNGGLSKTDLMKVSNMLNDTKFNHILYPGVFVQQNVKFDRQPFY